MPCEPLRPNSSGVMSNTECLRSGRPVAILRDHPHGSMSEVSLAAKIHLSE